LSYFNPAKAGRLEPTQEVPMEILAVAVGATICLMLVANAALQQVLAPAAALVTLHLAGLVFALPLAVLVRVRGPKSGPVPWYLATGGLVGVVLLLINNRTIPVLGPGLTVALGVVGQLAASAAIDHLGLFGLPKRPFRPVQAVGWAVALGGVFLMAGV
jgi:transporter family-2 protein